MEPLKIAEQVKEKFPIEVQAISGFRGQVSITVRHDRILDICRYLRDEPDIHMDFLADLCGVDYPGRKHRFEVIYNLFSIKYRSYYRET